MPPTVKMKEKKQQSAEIRVQQEAVRQMQNATQGMNGENLMQGSRQEVQKTRFSVLEEEVMRIASEANKQAALMAQQLTLVRNLKDLFETNQKKLIHQDNSRKISEADLKQFVAELQTEFNKNKIELLKTASTLCNLKREQFEKQIELTEEAMRQSNMEIPPLVNEMVRSYESYDIRSYVQRQQELREKLMERLGQIQRTSPIFQERRYASLLLSYLHSEQMGELVKKSQGKEVRVYDKSYGGFDVQLEKKDRPYIDRLKSVKDEPLFAHDPMLKDIHQGALGDCYFLAALAGIVAKNPETIKEMMKDNGNGTVTVRFYDFVKDDGLLGDGRTYKKPYYVTVDKTIPERTYLDRHSKGDSYSKGALWVKMMEKAYSAVRDHDDKKYNHLKIRGKGETINYTEIESGQSHLALQHLTGESFYYYSDLKKTTQLELRHLGAILRVTLR